MSHVTRIIALPLAFAVACGGGQKTETTPQDTDPEPQEQTQDFVFNDYDEVRLEGQRFRPEALPQPPMLRVVPKGKTTLAKARSNYQKAKAKDKEQELQILATLLWDESKKFSDKDTAKEQALRDEARKALADFRAEQAEAAEVTLLMSGAHAIYRDDFAEAVAIYEQLLERFPESKRAADTRAQLAYLYLRNNQLPKAAALVEGWQVSAELPAEQAYVLAWVRFRQGQLEQARQAIARAVQGWQGAIQGVESDALLMHAYAVAPVEEVSGTLATFAERAQDKAAKQYYLLFQQNLAYQQAGQFVHAAGMLDAAAAANPEMPPLDRVAFPSLKYQYFLFANQPEQVVENIMAAWDALQACGDPCAANLQQQQQMLLDNVQKLALHFHTIYATSLDERYFEPASSLYQFYLQDEGRPNHGQVQTYLNQLKETKENAQPASGKHNKEMMGTIVDFRKQGLVRCYEIVLQREPELQGTVSLTLNVDATGEVTGVETEPKAGEEGLSAVARCIDGEVRTWSFPGRSVKGTTAVVVPVSFARKAQAGQPAAKSAAKPAGEAAGN